MFSPSRLHKPHRKERYEEIIRGLELELSLDDEFETIEKNFREKEGSELFCAGQRTAAELYYFFHNIFSVLFFYFLLLKLCLLPAP